MIIVVTLPCCGPHRRHRAHGGVGTVPVERWLPNMLDVALMLSLQSTRHVRTASHAPSVALPLPLATPSGPPPETSGCPAVCAWSRLAGAGAGAPADVRARRHAAHECGRGSSRPGTRYASRISPAGCPPSHTGLTAAATGSLRQINRAGRNTPLRACTGLHLWRDRGFRVQRGCQTLATPRAGYRSGNWWVWRDPAPGLYHGSPATAGRSAHARWQVGTCAA